MAAPGAPSYAFSALELLLRRRRESGDKLAPGRSCCWTSGRRTPRPRRLQRRGSRRFGDDLHRCSRSCGKSRLAGGSLSQVKMVARGLREQLDLARGSPAEGPGGLPRTWRSAWRPAASPSWPRMASLSQTLEGAGIRLKRTLKRRVDHLLDWHAGPVRRGPFDFIRSMNPIGTTHGRRRPRPSFRPALYRLFQEFAKALGRFVTSEVNITARVLEFVRIQEEWLRQELWPPADARCFSPCRRPWPSITGKSPPGPAGDAAHASRWSCPPTPGTGDAPAAPWPRHRLGALRGRPGCAPARVSWAGPGSP